MSDHDLHDAANAPGGGWGAAAESSPAAAGGDTAPRVGFCQDCGKPVTAETVRMVGTGVFCEPCLAARVAASGGTAGYAGVPPAGAPPVPPLNPPMNTSPVLAGFLGLIPGVGAMYNGQFAKAVAHLAIFVLLKLLEESVTSVFGLLVMGWVFYQVFDAYHTAKARQQGLPLPNPFGLNDIGERMGFGRNWPNAGASTWGAGARSPAGASWQTTTPPTPPAATPPVPPTSGPDWVGYVPPTHFAGYAPPSYAAPYTAAAPSTAPAPYTAASYGVPYTPVVPPTAPLPDLTTNPNQLPVGALWLIGLGVLILVANTLPHWGMNEQWWPPILFAGLAVWITQRRLRRGASLVHVLRAPAILLTLAIFGALHAAFYRVNFGLFCAVLFIVIGALLLLERTVGAASMYRSGAMPPRASFVPAPDPVVPPPSGAGDEGEAR